MSPSSVNISIIDGPNAGRVINALEYAYDKISPMLIQLTLGHSSGNLRGSLPQEKITARVQGLRYESGTSGMFILYLSTTIQGKPVDCEAFYNANERRGNIVKM